ncbi:hypothetical protein VP496E541_P0200 [Vibrio phage 496E54-1]|nr:hypothetical protein VP495E541_P0200 [Vibrio phage 495E54-1]CAH9014445.1 hypothetical protein VP496E541_P0200 [Vibrio phage 496E54-1]
MLYIKILFIIKRNLQLYNTSTTPHNSHTL